MRTPRLFARRRGDGRNQDAPAPDNHLPLDMVAALDAAAAVDRGQDEAGNRRIVVLISGGAGGSFVYEAHAAERWMRGRWPDLNDAQVRRAAAMLHDRVSAFLQRAEFDAARAFSLASAPEPWARPAPLFPWAR